MEVRLDGNFVNCADACSYEEYGVSCWWNGIIFIPGFKEGRDSVAELLRRYKGNGSIDFINLMGSFNFVLKEKEEIIFFTDNGISRCFFYDSDMVSDNMLDIVNKKADFHFNDKNICQYLMFGKIFNDETYVDGVFLTNSSMYYTTKNGQITKKEKEIGDLNTAHYGISPSQFSEYLCIALSQTQKTLSLTGGFDSRYVLSLFLDKCQIAASVSGGFESGESEHPDFLISRKVAEEAGISYKQVNVNKPMIDEQYIRDAFVQRGGYFNTLNDANFRLNEYLKIRKGDGFSCIMTGDSGVFHKDDDWYQYFPFYNCKYFSIKRLYNNFVLNIKRSLPMSDKLYNEYSDIEKSLIEKFSNERQAINTKNLDWLNWYEFRSSAYKPLYNSQNHIMCSYPPLLEYRHVIYSYNLPRKQRRLARAMKEYITSVDLSVARIPTATGVTASSEKKYAFVDEWYSFVNIFKSGLRLLGRKILKKSILTHSATTWSCEDEIRNLEIAEDAIKFAAKNQWLKENCKMEDLPYDMLLKLLEIYLLNDYRNNMS